MNDIVERSRESENADDRSGSARKPELRPPPSRETAAAKKTRRLRIRLAIMVGSTFAPMMVAGLYAGFVATPQYRSEFSFVVRQQSPTGGAQSSIASMMGGGNPMLGMIEDSQAVVKYIRSYQILTDIDAAKLLPPIYSGPKIDWLARLPGRASSEMDRRYWRRVVSPSFDMTSGIITVDVRSFSPNDARSIAKKVLGASEGLVNRMSDQARKNALAYAEKSAEERKKKLLASEMQLAAYRNAHAIVFPQLTAGANTSVTSRLASELAQDRATVQALETQGQTPSSPQIRTLNARIGAIHAEIGHLGSNMTSATDGENSKTLASVLTGYDDLKIKEGLDLKLYTSDMEALQSAMDRANQKQVYLESIVDPNLPQESTYPIAWIWACEAGIIGFMLWLILSVLSSTVTDHFE
jgi:capsular polysaccharide transport system permease protein